MKRYIWLLLVPGLAFAAPRTVPTIPVVDGLVLSNAVITDDEGTIFLEFLRNTYVVDPAYKEALRSIDLLSPQIVDKLRANEGEEDSAVLKYLEGKYERSFSSRGNVSATEILPPEIVAEPEPNQKPYISFVTGFKLYTSTFTEVAFTDKSRSKTKGIKLLMIPPEGSRNLKLWEYRNNGWRRIGGLISTAEGTGTEVFTAYIDGTGTYAIYEEAPEAGGYEPISRAEDPILLKPFTVPDGLNTEEAINFHLTEIDRYKFLQESLGEYVDPVPPERTITPIAEDRDAPSNEIPVPETPPESESEQPASPPEVDEEVNPKPIVTPEQPAPLPPADIIIRTPSPGNGTLNPLPIIEDEEDSGISSIDDDISNILALDPDLDTELNSFGFSAGGPDPVPAVEPITTPTLNQIPPELPQTGNEKAPETNSVSWYLLGVLISIIGVFVWSFYNEKQQKI